MAHQKFKNDSVNASRRHRDISSKNLLTGGIFPLILLFPELWKLHSAGNDMIMFLIGLGLYIAGTVCFVCFVMKPIRNKCSDVEKQDFRIMSAILLIDLVAVLLLVARVKLGIFTDGFIKS